MALLLPPAHGGLRAGHVYTGRHKPCAVKKWSLDPYVWPDVASVRTRRNGRPLSCQLVGPLEQGAATFEKTISQGGWTAQDSAGLYRLEGWGSPYFSVNAAGNLVVKPTGDGDEGEIDIMDLLGDLGCRGIQPPIVIRFPQIIRDRMHRLQDCFNVAIQRYGYERNFQGVFPVKCNQDRYIIEEIVNAGRDLNFGLEVGSKPELLIAMAKLQKSSSDALLICNGYKDFGYIESALLACQLGINAVVVLEQVEELGDLLSASKKMGVKPIVGVRAKLGTKHEGHWGGTSGDGAKFGLNVNELLEVVHTLKEEGELECLQLLHFHIGSQIPSIAIVKEAMREASHLYCELALLGASMKYIDVGGGLGIDYDGSKSQGSSSTNYSMQNYANDVVAALLDACVLKKVPQPIIVSESGRALASHHSVLVTNVLSSTSPSRRIADRQLEMLTRQTPSGSVPAAEAGAYLLETFRNVLDTTNESNFQESYNDAKQFKKEAASLFKLGCMSLEQRALAEAIHQAICHRVLSYAEMRTNLAEELSSLNQSMAATYHVNLSVFRSVPDSWAIQQIFPIMPLHRLQEQPLLYASLADLTCDSDGKISRFINPTGGEPRATLPVHALRKGEKYFLGFFLGGAYQEAMGSQHNLFGRTNSVCVRAAPKATAERTEAHGDCCTEQNSVYGIELVMGGQSTAAVLATVQYSAKDLLSEFEGLVETAIANGSVKHGDAQKLVLIYERNLEAYTYLAK